MKVLKQPDKPERRGCSGQSQRDCVLQPRVARHELPWVGRERFCQPQRGCGSVGYEATATPLGLGKSRMPLTQGSSYLAILGFGPESRWDSDAGVIIVESWVKTRPGRFAARRLWQSRTLIGWPVLKRPEGRAPGTHSALLALLAILLLLALPIAVQAEFSPGDSYDFPLDTRGADSGVGVNQSDSADFPLDTTGSDLVAGGVLHSDSADFVLDTTAPDTGFGALLSDSADFILDTTAADTGLGVLLADSPDFALDTRAADTGLGFLLADSADFMLDTRGADAGMGILLADSPDFPLDTREWLDIGLRVFDGLAAIKIAVEAPGIDGWLASALQVHKGGTNYGIMLIPTNWPDASRIRIQTSAGPKAWRKIP